MTQVPWAPCLGNEQWAPMSVAPSGHSTRAGRIHCLHLQCLLRDLTMASGQPLAWTWIVLPMLQRHKVRRGQQHGPFQCEASSSQPSVLLVCHGGNCEGQTLGRDPAGACLPAG